jgi:hypothetical protein
VHAEQALAWSLALGIAWGSVAGGTGGKPQAGIVRGTNANAGVVWGNETAASGPGRCSRTGPVRLPLVTCDHAHTPAGGRSLPRSAERRMLPTDGPIRGLTREVPGAATGHTGANEPNPWEQEDDMSTMLTAAMALAIDPTLPAFFLDHLAGLAERQAATTNAKERAALRVALFSTYLDCLDLGLGSEAQRIMGPFQQDAQTLDLVAA